MNTDQLLRPGRPCFHSVVMDEDAFANLYLVLTSSYPEAAVRIIRGRKSRTVTDFFNEVSAALQFPYYFGENWAAFDECIKDLDWLPANAYVLLISSAHLLLEESEADFRVLLRILAEANENWETPNKYFPRNLPTTPFHILFQCPEADLAVFLPRLEAVGVQAEYIG